MKLLSFIFIGLTLLIPQAFATEITEATLPHNLVLESQSGETQSFDTLTGEQGLVLFFIRSVSWCPFCQAQLKDLNTRTEDFKQKGYNVAALSYDPVSDLERFATQQSIQYPLLSDKDSTAIKAFGLLNTDVRESSPHYGIPNPAVIVIKKDKTTQRVYQEDGYKVRPDLDEILGNLVEMHHE